ncbi:hypothetical protein [uncultured Boseongicola sp.]|uniref:hypothetical protein n=1 Tax=uncultured Boseongicola sp. TaxID=1648499 RepID=UPI002633DE9B|nr:hypothetical protein [uncultured Boseongicola sp.]
MILITENEATLQQTVERHPKAGFHTLILVAPADLLVPGKTAQSVIRIRQITRGPNVT